MRRGLRSGLVASCNEIYNVVKSSGNRFYLVIILMIMSGSVFGQTTVSYSFTGGSTSGTLDANIAFTTAKNSSSTNPGVFSNQLRLYQHATKGGSIIITPSNGAVITSVIVNASGTTGPAAYNVDGAFVANFTASTTYAMSGVNAASQVEFYQRDSNSSKRIYVNSFTVTYTLAASCSGAPSAGSTVATTNPVPNGNATTLSLSGASTESGLTYKWQSSPNNGTYTDIPSATSDTYTTTPTLKAWYRCAVTCSGNTSYSSPLEVNLTYCTSQPTSLDFSGISQVVVGASTFSVPTQTYYNYTGSIPNLTAGTLINSAVTFQTEYGYDMHIWIDLNDDGVFDTAAEKVFTGESTESESPTVLNSSFSLSAAANLGQHKMRIGSADSGQSSPNPCYSDEYGVTIDLTVNILSAGFTVTFNNNGGTGTMANQTASVATALTTNAFTRTGYVFAGWNTASNGSGTSYADGASFPFAADTTLYAQWTAITTTLADNGTPIAAGNITQGTNNNIVASFTLAQATANNTLTEARFITGGNYTAADINGNGFRLWYNTTNNFGTATQISNLPSTAAGSGELLEYTGLYQTLTAGNTGYFWVTANLSLAASVGNTLNVDFINPADFTVSTGSVSGSASASGTKTVIATVSPTLTVTPTFLTDFGTVCIGSDSGTQSYTLSGVNLTADVIVTAPSGFRIRKGAEAFASTTTVTPDGLGEVSTTIEVLYRPSAAGASGTLTITHESTGATTKNVSVSGTGSNGTVAVTTTAASSITATGASSGGTATSTSCGTITAKGVVWGTTANPTVPSANSTNEGAGTANYTSAIAGLTPNTVYHYRSYATNSNGSTSYGTDAAFTTVSNAPSSPTAGTETTSGFTASWTAPTGQGSAALTYTVRIYSDNTFTTLVGSPITGISGTSIVISSLSSGTTYYYQVVAVNAGGSSSSANFSSGVTTLSLPNLVISEFAGAGYGNSANNEYIEISNLGSSAVSLSGWTLEYYNASTLEATATLTGSIAANSAYVIAARTSYTSAITPNFVVGSPMFMNSAGYAVLKMGSTIIDQAGTASGKFSDNKNYEFTNCTSDNSVVANWDDLGTGNGTPGVVNCACTAQTTSPIAAAVTKTTTDAAYSVATTATSGLTVTYTSSNTGVATVDASGTVTIIGVGTTTITASQAGNSTYCAAPNVTQTLTVVATPVVTGAALAGNVGTAFNHTIAATNSPTSYSVIGTLPPGLTQAGAVISGTPTTAGTYSVTITATNIAGTSAPAAFDFNIAKGNQTITFAAINKTYGDADFNLTATASSGLAVTYTSSNTSAATVSGTTVTIIGAGTTNITASQGGDANWNAATDNVKVLTVAPKALTVNGLSVSNKEYDGLTSAALNGTGNLVGVVFSDDVSLSAPSAAAFANKNAGTGKTVSVTYSLQGTKASNYTLTQPTLTATITQKAITITGAQALNKAYDGTTSAFITGAAVGVVGSDVVSVIGGGTFASANVGTAIPVTSNLTLGGADQANYTLAQPTGLTANIAAIAPTFTATTIGLSIGGTYNLPGGNISSTSAGALSYSITGGGTAALSGNTLTGVSIGSETLTVDQAANGNYLAGSTTVTVTTLLVTYETGDYRTNPDYTGTIFFSSTNASGGIRPWQVWNGAAWADVTGDSTFSPQGLATKPENIYIISGSLVDLAGGATYNNIIIESASTYVQSANTSTGLTIASGKTLDIKAGYFDLSGRFSLGANANLYVRTAAELEIGSTTSQFSRNASSNFTIEDEGYVYVNNYLANLWTGNENFAGESYFTIYGWDRTVQLFASETDITNNSLGSKFGYLEIDLGASGINGNWTFVFPTGETFILTHKDFNITNGTVHNVSLNGQNVTIGADCIVNTTNTGALQLQTQATQKTLTVKGNFVKNGSGIFRMTNSGSGYVTTLTIEGDLNVNQGTFFLDSGSTSLSTSIINLKGNLYKSAASTMVNSNTNSTTNAFNFTGTTPQTVDVGVNASNDMLRYRFFIKNGAYVKPINQNWQLATDSRITVENGGTFDFGFAPDGLALLLTETISSATTLFAAEPGSTLKITSDEGIGATGTASGNILLDTRNYASGGIYGDFHYIGKTNQTTGTGLPANVRNLTIRNESSSSDVTLTNTVAVNNILTMANGNIVTGANRLDLGIDTTTRGTLDHTEGVVKGTMRRWFGAATNSGAATGLFPLGTAANLKRFATLEYTAAPALGGSVTAVVDETAMGNTGLAALTPVPATGGCPSFSVLSTEDSFWNFTPGTLTGGTYTLTLRKQSSSTIEVCKQTLLKRDVLDWTKPGTHVEPSGTPTDIVVSRSGLSGLSMKDFGLGNAHCPAASIVYNGSWPGSVLPTYLDTVEFTEDFPLDSGIVQMCECKVVAGKTVTIASGATLQLMNGINIESGLNPDGSEDGRLIIEDGGSLVQIVDVDNATANNNIGKILMHRHTKPMFRYDFTYWSSPVHANDNSSDDAASVLNGSEFNLKQLSPGTLFDKYYKWNAPSQAWQTITSGAESMVPGRGYIVRAPQSFPIEGSAGNPSALVYDLGAFVGKPNNGTVEHPVEGGTGKWNLIGNPYPSAISAASFLAANIADTNTNPTSNQLLDGTLYFWTHNTGIVPIAPGSQAYTYNSGDYASWNETGSAATTDTSLYPANIPGDYIAAGQSFFVRGVNSGSAIFNNSMRVAGNNNQFFRPAPTEPMENWDTTGRHRVWLNIKGQAKGFSQMLVGYIQHATNDLDRRFDGEIFGGNQVLLYSVLEDKKLVIQGRSLPFNNQDEVPLGYKSTLNGTLTISIDHFDGLFEGQDIYLEDKVLDIVHDLKAAAYNFTTVVGTFNDRFVLRYLPSEELGNPDHGNIANGLVVYQEENKIMVKSQLEALEQVTVYDLLGRTIFDKSTIGKNEFGIENVVMDEQPLIIKVKLANGQIVNRKIVY